MYVVVIGKEIIAREPTMTSARLKQRLAGSDAVVKLAADFKNCRSNYPA